MCCVKLNTNKVDYLLFPENLYYLDDSTNWSTNKVNKIVQFLVDNTTNGGCFLIRIINGATYVGNVLLSKSNDIYFISMLLHSYSENMVHIYGSTSSGYNIYKIVGNK